MPRKTKKQLHCAAIAIIANKRIREKRMSKSTTTLTTDTYTYPYPHNSTTIVTIDVPIEPAVVEVDTSPCPQAEFTFPTVRRLEHTPSRQENSDIPEHTNLQHETQEDNDTQPTPEHTEIQPETQEDNDTQPTPDTEKTKNEILRNFSTEWMENLSQHDFHSLGVFLCHLFSEHLNKKKTEAARLAANIIGASGRAVREWRKAVVKNNGVLPDNKRGKYERRLH